ncbi:MAG: SUMF1/EgtB/PvdO family nonheme iron enzyme [Lentisphaerae bacterium]|nr:SUMF1/EgtB/PvdO family nonheme iron enzyme [Lentisphaerota bacterium]
MPTIQQEVWPNTDKAFSTFATKIDARTPRNLLARRKVRLSGLGNASMLADGIAGERGGAGRVGAGGKPTVIVCYLGQPKTVREIGVYTFNIDARANQDYEVRVVNNSANPGKQPVFEGPPLLTTGPKVVGPNSGGCHTWFRHEDSAPLVDGEVDWVEFRIWRTYNVKAGHPAQSETPTSWTSLIEFEVIGNDDDVIVRSPEEIARRKALQSFPRNPEFTNRETWQETMVAAREAVLAWEVELDRLAQPESGVVLEPWQIAGPFAPGSPGFKQAADAWDLAKVEAMCKALPFKPFEGAGDGRETNLAKSVPAAPGQAIILVRKAVAEAEFDRTYPFEVGMGAGIGEIRCLPSRRRQWFDTKTGPATPNSKLFQLSLKPSPLAIVAILRVREDGTCPFWFSLHALKGPKTPGTFSRRIYRRQNLYRQLQERFPDPLSQAEIAWEREDSIWMRFTRRAMSRIDWHLTDWPTSRPDFLVAQYNAARATRLQALQESTASAPEALVSHLKQAVGQAETPPAQTIADARKAYYAIAALQDMAAAANQIHSARLAVTDQQATFGTDYPKADEKLARITTLEKQIAALLAEKVQPGTETVTRLLALKSDISTVARDILLTNPLLGFERLLMIKGGPGFSSNWGGANRLGNEVVSLSPVAPDGELTTVYKGSRVSDMDVNWDARRILLSDGRHLHELDTETGKARQISTQTDRHVMHYDGCYLPNGRIAFVSTACEQAVPCTGGWYVGNLHLMEADGTNERRITFDQDHSWNPCVLNSGRVIFTRWEYTDTPHYFTRLLFHMNPDGSEQMEYYGSNSYWPNALYWTRPIPGHPTKVVAIVSGHHGVGRMGELAIFDPALGRHEAQGAIQKIPGYGKPVDPVIKDGLVSESWPRFATPWPLAEPETHRGAGKYFLVACKMTPYSSWGVYLADIFDNLTPLLMGPYSMPVPWRPRPRPPIVPDKVDRARTDAHVVMSDVYEGGGISGFPKGTVKALRIGSHHYRYGGNGDTRGSSYEGGWDVKRILGTVPVEPDGSAFFKVPANTPIFVQPIDADGKALQTMRSWFAAMPGETVSCVGCHEPQNQTAPVHSGQAFRRGASEITPWFGPVRGFSFDREVQPVLDRRCVGCHSGAPRKDKRAIPDLRAKRLHPDFKGPYSPAYMALHAYVRRAGYEADYHLAAPAEYHADTSQLVQMLTKGHHGVTLTPEEWRRLYTWIDYNIPYPANWRESHRPPKDDQIERRAKYKKLYAAIEDNDEAPVPLPPVAAFEPPQRHDSARQAVTLEGWPLSREAAGEQQRKAALPDLTLELAPGVDLEFVPVPRGAFLMGDTAGFPDENRQERVVLERSFYLSKLEVTNSQFGLFDPYHDSRFVAGRGKDRFTRGYPVNQPEQPVVRVTYLQAKAFCEWLTTKTGAVCRLPTEQQWEYACKAGSSTLWPNGDDPKNAGNRANISDASLTRWNWGRCEKEINDGARFSVPGGKYPANAWGLHDMIGNVAEWTASDYAPGTSLKVVRGGSWNDTLRYARSSSRWRYAAHQPVYNVGFRVLCEAPAPTGKARARAR